MAEHGKNQTRLHKEISSIFKGVPIPNDDGIQRSSVAPAADHISCPVQRPPAPEPQNLQNPKAGEPYQPPQPLQKAAPAQKPKTEVEKCAPDKRSAVKVVNQTFWQPMKNRLFAPRRGVGAGRQKVMVVLAPFLFVVMVLVLIQALSVPARTKAETGQGTSVNIVAASYEIDWKIPALYSATYRDPMRPGSATITQTETEGSETDKITRLTIKSIVYSEDNPSAVIGSRIVHEGEKVLGATVVKINKDSVEFEAGGKKWKQNI
jgi:hypothetical protein